MKIFQLKSLIILLLLQSSIAFSQDDEFYDPNYLQYKNIVYDSKIKTVQLFRKGWNETFPVIDLNERADILHLTFDDLNDNLRNLGYTFIHCEICMFLSSYFFFHKRLL